jgi:hypothetical protein
MEDLTVKEQKTGWSKTYNLDTSTTTQLQFKQLISQDSNIDVQDIRVLCGGKFLKDDTVTLQASNVKSSTKILILRRPTEDNNASTTSSSSQPITTPIQQEEQKIKRLQRIRRAAEEMARREGGGTSRNERYHMVLENQNGEKVRLPRDQTQRLMTGMCMQKIGQSFMKKKEYRDALDCFEMADEEWRLVDPQIMSTVDNYANLNIDLVWTMYQMKDLGALNAAKSRLTIAQQILERAHGKNQERLLQIRNGFSPELILYARLHLLQAIVAYHDNNYREAQQLLWKSEFELKNLVLEPHLVDGLIQMGFSEQESKEALRASRKNVENSINFILQQREIKEKRRQEDRKRREERREQLRIGVTSDGSLVNIQTLNQLTKMGYDRDLVIEALKLTNNHEDNTQFLLLNQKDMLEGCAEKTIWKRLTDITKLTELLNMGFDLHLCHFALKKTNNVLDQAVNLLIEGRVNPQTLQTNLHDPRTVDDDIYGDTEMTESQQEESDEQQQEEQQQQQTDDSATSPDEDQEENNNLAQQQQRQEANERLKQLLEQRRKQQQQEDEMEELIYKEIVLNMENADFDPDDDLSNELSILTQYLSKFTTSK